MGSRREPLSPKLGQIVEEAYHVFACPPPPDLGVCQFCCMYPEIETDFLNHSPRELTEAYIRDWYFAAVAGENGRVVHKPIANWVMPRVLEMLAQGAEPASVGDEVVLQRLAAGDSTRWNDNQNHVLERFQWAYIDNLPNCDDRVMLDDVLCMFALAGFETPPLTDHLMGWSDAALVNTLWRDWVSIYNHRSIWRTAFWEANELPAQHIWNWYLSEDLQERMTRIALDDEVNDQLCRRASDVELTIRESRGS